MKKIYVILALLLVSVQFLVGFRYFCGALSEEFSLADFRTLALCLLLSVMTENQSAKLLRIRWGQKLKNCSLFLRF